ncbi:MAG: hypothetical protein M1833_000237 [Piccolia ochrophora]|nr:MAG: hypothetical protein M1833_000237 [Piccolia ochrophora]
MSTAIRYNYIISRNLDPLFALFIGLSAAAVRIRREEVAKGTVAGGGLVGEVRGLAAVGSR